MTRQNPTTEAEGMRPVDTRWFGRFVAKQLEHDQDFVEILRQELNRNGSSWNHSRVDCSAVMQ
jgi:hypothetical protein